MVIVIMVVVQVQDESNKKIICLKLATTWRSRASEDVPKSVSPIVAYGGAIHKSSPSGARSRKVVQLEMIKIVII